MFNIRKKPLQLLFIASLFIVFIFFMGMLFLSDKPKPPTSKTVIPEIIEPKSEETIIEGEYLFDISIPIDDSYSTISNKAEELNAKIIYFNRNENKVILSFTNEFDVKQITIKLKRKFLDSSVEYIENFTPVEEKLEEVASIINTTIFSNPQNKFMFSMPLNWNSEILDNIYQFTDEEKNIILKIHQISKNEKNVKDFLDTHIQNSLNNGFVLDGVIEEITTDENTVHYKWSLTNNDIVIPQGLIETSDEFYFFESQKELSFDNFSLTFDTVQVY
jgi:hypothetical protein